MSEIPEWFLQESTISGRENAQRLWLDKILELAIEAGTVEVNDGMD
jgi:hypothetical protein